MWNRYRYRHRLVFCCCLLLRTKRFTVFTTRSDSIDGVTTHFHYYYLFILLFLIFSVFYRACPGHTHFKRNIYMYKKNHHRNFHLPISNVLLCLRFFYTLHHFYLFYSVFFFCESGLCTFFPFCISSTGPSLALCSFR